jgi:hypothetical protein
MSICKQQKIESNHLYLSQYQACGFLAAVTGSRVRGEVRGELLMCTSLQMANLSACECFVLPVMVMAKRLQAAGPSKQHRVLPVAVSWGVSLQKDSNECSGTVQSQPKRA